MPPSRDLREHVARLDFAAIYFGDLPDTVGLRGCDLVEDLHRFDDEERRPLYDGVKRTFDGTALRPTE